MITYKNKEYPVKGEWINTDDMQRCRMIKPGIYELIEANEARGPIYGRYAISSPMIVDISDYKTADGYTKEAVSIIKSYHSGGVEEFKNSYSKESDRDQVLAEMIYESTSQLYDYPDIYPEETAEKILDYYCRTGKMIEDPTKNIAVNADDLIEYIRQRSYPVRYDSNSIENGMTMTGIEQAVREYFR